MHTQLPKTETNTSPQVKNILKWILLLNLLVLVIKAYIGIKSGSLSIIGDSVHSGIDSINNIIALLMIKLASEPPDNQHPYGHEKFETLGALAVVAFLAITSFELIEKSIMRLLNPNEFPKIDSMTIWLLALTLAVNIFVWLYEKSAAKKFNSYLLGADAEHTFSDILVTSSILLSVIFIARGYLWLDPLLCLFIAFVILRSGWIILKDTIPILVDEAWLQAEDISALIINTPRVVGFTHLRSRRGRDRNFIEMTVKFDTDSLLEAHALSHQIEEKIIHKFGQAEVTIHIEPG
jgi:cation diffusion facilitator family transporter